MNPQNMKLWKDRRLSEEQAVRAEAAMAHMLSALRAAGVLEREDEVAQVVYQEAMWQLLNIPRLDTHISEQLRWVP